jgi:DNA polymerase-1
MSAKVLVDGANAWYRAYCQAEKLGLDAPGAPVVIMSYMIKKPCIKYGKNNVIICWDAGDSGRKLLDDAYKGKRKKTLGVWEDAVYMYKMIDCLGVANASKTGYEADDVIGSLAEQSDDPILILSYDKDFYQLVNDRIKVLRPARTIKGREFPEKIIEKNDVVEEFGCPTDKVILFKSFRGDASDNIPKLPIRFTKNFQRVFYKVLNMSSSLEGFYSKIELFDKKYHDELNSFRKRAALNYELVKIKTDLDVDVEQEKLDAGAFDNLCLELSIKRLKIIDWETIPFDPAPPPPTQGCLF